MEKKNNYTAKINDNTLLEINNQEFLNLDFVSLGENKFHILKNSQSFKVEVIHTDFENKTFTIKINGNEQQIQLLDHYDLLIQKMGLNISSDNKMNEVKAPMPGLVLDVLVEAGQTFEKGEPLLILEAMKMENVIKASAAGVIKDVKIAQGDKVEKLQKLITYA